MAWKWIPDKPEPKKGCLYSFFVIVGFMIVFVIIVLLIQLFS
jgi:hypothetical protein